MNPVTLTNLTTQELLALAADSPDPLTRTLAARFSQALDDSHERGYWAGHRAAQDEAA